MILLFKDHPFKQARKDTKITPPLVRFNKR